MEIPTGIPTVSMGMMNPRICVHFNFHTYAQRALILFHFSLSLPFSQWRLNEYESGGTGPVRKWGAPIRRKAPEIFLSCPSTFLALNAQFVVFGERLRDGQYRVVSFLFAVFLLTVPHVPSHL